MGTDRADREMVAALTAADLTGGVVTVQTVEGDDGALRVGVADADNGAGPLARVCAMAADLTTRGHRAVAVVVTARDAPASRPLHGARMSAVTLDRPDEAVAADLQALGVATISAWWAATVWTAAAAEVAGESGGEDDAGRRRGPLAQVAERIRGGR